MVCERTTFYSEYLKRVVTIVADGRVVYGVTLEELQHHEQKGRATAVTRACQAYLAGEDADLQDFSMYLEGLTTFERSVLMATRRIPKGRVTTYAALAECIGRPRAARAVGNALARNPLPLFVPCHRVISKESVGGFSCGIDVKLKLLQLEGVLL